MVPYWEFLNPCTIYCTILTELRANKEWALEMTVEAPLMKAIVDASMGALADYLHQQGWVIIALQNALWQLLHAANLEEGVVDTVMRGGDTDTNAAIAGALLGAVYGRDAIPEQWISKLLNCRPQAGQPHVRHPRPECFVRWMPCISHDAWSKVGKIRMRIKPIFPGIDRQPSGAPLRCRQGRSA